MSQQPFHPKQSLGQNFLKDENVARKIVGALAPKRDDAIIEIGPGFGVLTAHLLQVARRVVGVEIDRHLLTALQQRFSGCDNLELIAGDFLKMELPSLCEPDTKVRVLGNIPYHITSPVIFKVLEARELMQDMVMMIQREVAERIVASPGCKQYGILSVFSQLHSVPKIAFYVSRNVFNPKPEVDSAVVRWDFGSAPELEIVDHGLLGAVIRSSFNQRRKMLRKSLQQLPGFRDKMEHIDFDFTRRPEDLSVQEFVDLSNRIKD